MCRPRKRGRAVEINAYLQFGGNCEEALAFYARVLGGKVVTEMRYGGSPMEGHVPAEWHDKLMHARIDIGGTVVMASDQMPGRAEAPAGFSMSISVGEAAEAERIFGQMAEGGIVQMALQETFWAVRFGVVVDRFGVPWMVNCERVG